MSTHNVRNELRASRAGKVLTLTATTTLTVAQLISYDVINLAGQALTLPTAAAALEGQALFIVDSTGSGTVTGMAGGTEYITMADGDLALVMCVNAQWNSAHHTSAAA